MIIGDHICGIYEFGPECLVSTAAWEAAGADVIAEALHRQCTGEPSAAEQMDGGVFQAAASLLALADQRDRVILCTHEIPIAMHEDGSALGVSLRIGLWSGAAPVELAGHRMGSLVAISEEWDARPQWGALQLSACDIAGFGIHDRYPTLSRLILARMLRD